MYQSDFHSNSYPSYLNNNNLNQQQPSNYKALPDKDNLALHYFCSNSVSSDINNNNYVILDNNISSPSFNKNTVSVSSDSLSPTFQSISSITSNTNTNTNVSKRKIKKSKKKNKQATTAQSYDPISSHRAQGIIQISKTLTEEIIPSLIKEQITDLYVYMDKSIALCNNCRFINDKIKILHFDFHHHKTNQVLYCVATKQDDTKRSSRGYQWKLVDQLFTAKQIYNEYKIGHLRLPKSVRTCDGFLGELCYAEKIKQFLMNPSQRQKLLAKSRWCKLDIFSKVNNKRRMTLSVTKPEFMKICSSFMNNNTSCMSDIKLIPIVMFSRHEYNKYWVEHLWVVRMSAEGIDVGISFKYDKHRNTVVVCGIHLDKDYIFRQHQLALPQHAYTCHCLDNFESNINDLRIGNPDDDKNRIKYYKQQIEQLQKRLNEINNVTAVNVVCGDKANVLNIETTYLTRQTSDNYHESCNSNEFIQNGSSIA